MNIEVFKTLLESKCPNSNFLLVVKRGSHAHGTNVESSDEDFSGVYIQSKEDIFGTKYQEQINDDKNDIVFYEVKRFLELLASNNPTILELMNTPEDCIIYKNPLFDILLEQKNEFITKACAKSFGGYAIQQIKKAKGQNKKQNWEQQKVTRKDILDFVYVIEDGKSILWKDWNTSKGFEERFIGVVNISNAKDVYALYYDRGAYMCFGNDIPEYVKENEKRWRKESGKPMGFGYKGLVNDNELTIQSESNQLKLSSIPKGEKPIANIFFNKDSYSQHCKDFHSYQEWIKNRNDKRWIDVESHGQKIDGKNMMHCQRLLEMAREIGQGRGIIVRRPNAQELLSIRRGQVDLQTLIDISENNILEIDELFEKSSLPVSVNPDLVNDILIKIRLQFYK